MLRIRAGEGWTEDPDVRAALARALPDSAELLVDAIAVEVDGVDLTAGRAEGPVLAGLESLARAAARLAGGAAGAQVHFPEGRLELVARRRGTAALLTIVSLERPSRVLAREVEVEIATLAAAVREAADRVVSLLAQLGTAPRAALTAPLRAALDHLAAARPAAQDPTSGPPAPPLRPRPRRRRDAPACGFELEDGEGLIQGYHGPGADLGSLLATGRVWLRAPAGEEVLSVAGAPFLLLRDLAALARRIVAADRAGEPAVRGALALPSRGRTLALAVDLAGGTLAVDERAPVECGALPLARALLEAAVDFCGVAAARNPWQAENPWVSELRASASEQLALVADLLAGDRPGSGEARVRPARPAPLPRAPLGAGRPRRIVHRRGWQGDAGHPVGPGLLRAPNDALIAVGGAAMAAWEVATGAPRWRRPGVEWAAADAGGSWLLALEGGTLVAVDLATGASRWTRPPPDPLGPPVSALALAGGPFVLATPGALVALDRESGRTLWRFAPPAVRALRAAAFGPLALVATDTGLAHALDGAGRTVWRARLPGPTVAAPQPLAAGALFSCTGPVGGQLALLDAASGRRRWQAGIDFQAASAAVPFAGLAGLAGTVGGDPVITAIDPATGAVAWTETAPLPDGPLALGSTGRLLVAKTAAGTCAALARDGAVRWSVLKPQPHPPPANLPPVAARGVVAVPSEHVTLVDGETGRVLGQARTGAPVRLVVGPDLSLAGVDAEGLVTTLRVATHLGVV